MTTSLDQPDEVVTHARVRFIPVPGSTGEIALITLDNGHDHTRPNTFGPAGLSELDAALDSIAAYVPAVRAIAVTGKPFIFAAGADLSGIGALRTRAQAQAIAELGHRVFGRFRDSAIPTFAFINGVALGGGLELALHCHYRTVAASAGAIAFPEVFLGLVPGWGGTQLMTRLVGADTAVRVIVENALNQNAMLTAAQAGQLGLFDVVLDDADFLVQSLRWAARIVDGTTTIARPTPDAESAPAALARGRAAADARLHGGAPAPYRALELIELAGRTDLAAGLAAEREALTELIMSEEFRSSIYSFDLVQKRARRPAGAPDRGLGRPVRKVGVLGAGLMAGQLALLFLRRLEVPVVITDLDQDRIDRGVDYVRAEIEKLRAKNRIGPDQANRLTTLISGSLDHDAFADADFVIEAVFEDLAVKQALFAELEKHVAPTAILASNTSALSITAIADGLIHPERVVGFHFFNPVAVLPLLEIVRGTQTDDATLATAFGVSRQLNKSSVLVKDAPAFVVNRLLTRFLGEVFAAVDEGTDLEVADSALEDLGLPMTPFMLLALVGPAVAAHVAGTLHEQFPDRFGVSSTLQRLVAAGKPGVYLWDESGRHLDPEVAALLEPGDSPSSAEQVRQRALTALTTEIGLMLDDGVVAEADDIDLCLLLGAGWPFHLGGITPYLDRSGTAEQSIGHRFHNPGIASLPE